MTRQRSAQCHLFAAGPVEHRKARIERLVHGALSLTTAALVVPLVAILGESDGQGVAGLSWSFLVENPTHDMTAGGIWAPLVGTFYLVLVSLLIAAPIGVLAGVYLNEYAGDNWFTRIVNLAVVNLAGVPSIVHALSASARSCCSPAWAGRCWPRRARWRS